MSFTRTIRHALRRWLARFAAFVLIPRSPPPPLDLTNWRKVLVLRIDERVGNVLLTTPLVAALQRALPNARVDLLVAASKARIVRDLANVITFERKAFFKAPFRFFAQLRRLRAEQYDAVIDASHWHEMSLSSALILGFIGTPIRVAHDRADAHRFATHLAPRPDRIEPELHTKMRLLAAIGLRLPLPPMTTALGTSESARAAVHSWVRGQGLGGKPLVVLAPGARKLDHRLPLDLFAAAGAEAKSRGADVIILWGPGEEDLARSLAAVSKALLAPPTDLDQLAAFLRAADVVVANDSGPMHLAVACGAATIAFFVHGDFGRWGHNSPPNRVISCLDRSADDAAAEARDAVRDALSRISSGRARLQAESMRAD